jgi:hypothetical protein
MSHAPTRPPVLRERIIAGLLGILEGFALSVLPRRPLRKRLLGLVDRAFARMHRQSCSEDGLGSRGGGASGDAAATEVEPQ